MKKILFMLLAMSNSIGYGDDFDAQTIHTNILNRLSVVDSTFSEGYTNMLIRYANSTSGTECVTAFTALGIALFDRFDTTGEVAALDNCAQICSNVLNDCSTASNLWQKAMASIVYASTFSQDGKYSRAYSICTNAMCRVPQEPQGEADKHLWNAMCSHQSSCSLSVANALRFYSALFMLMIDSHCSCTAYTNALPQDAILKIQQVLD